MKHQEPHFAVSGRLTTMIAILFFGLFNYSAHGESDPAAIFAASDRVPMEFFVAKGARDSCGDGCDSWIAAEGRIDAQAAVRFQRFLTQIDHTDLPVFFSSEGGELDPSLEIGRILRKRAIRAGIGLTVPADCMRTRPVQECRLEIRRNAIGDAILWSASVKCVSGCAYAILGATRREIAPEAFFGVHAISADTSKLMSSQGDLTWLVERSVHQADKDLLAYLSEMGFSEGLNDIAKQAKSVHFLSRQELYDFGIDRRQRIESDWAVRHLDVSATGEAIFKSLALKTRTSTSQFERSALAISCDYHPKNSYVLSVLRFFPDTTRTEPFDIEIGDGDSSFLLRDKDAYQVSYSLNTIEVRQSKLSRGAVEKLLSAPAINVVEKAAANILETPSTSDTAPAISTFSLSTAGALEPFETMSSYCSPPR